MKVVGVFLLVLTFTLPPATYLFIPGSADGAEGSPILTATTMFLPVLITVIMLWVSSDHERCTMGTKAYLLYFAWATIVISWYVIYVYELNESMLLSLYDQKRPYFFFHGFVAIGLIALEFARRGWCRFALEFNQIFFLWGCIIGVVYVATFDPAGEIVQRLGGTSGLARGKILSVAASCAVALLYLRKTTKLALTNNLLIWGGMLVLLVGTFLSGTRGALVAWIASSLLIFMKATGRTRAMAGWGGLMVMALFFSLGNEVAQLESQDWGAVQMIIQRMSNLEEGGADLREEMAIAAIDSFQSNLAGKTVGYLDTFSSIGSGNNEYSHNTVLQILIELGLCGLVPAMIVAMFFLVGFMRLISSELEFSLLFPFLNVLIQSLSSGTGYDIFVWFVIFYVASIGALTPLIDKVYCEPAHYQQQ